MKDQSPEYSTQKIHQNEGTAELSAQDRFIEDRCANSKIDVVGRLRWIDQMSELVEQIRSRIK